MSFWNLCKESRERKILKRGFEIKRLARSIADLSMRQRMRMPHEGNCKQVCKQLFELTSPDKGTELVHRAIKVWYKEKQKETPIHF